VPRTVHGPVAPSRLRDAGKCAKATLIAAARKLLTILNAILRDLEIKPRNVQINA
jgi:hypothetical protein